jgi:ABC-type multidrug transport system fused ATPase/permease subunit
MIFEYRLAIVMFIILFIYVVPAFILAFFDTRPSYTKYKDSLERVNKRVNESNKEIEDDL